MKKSLMENFIFCALNTLKEATNCINSDMFNLVQKSIEISCKTEKQNGNNWKTQPLIKLDNNKIFWKNL